MVFTADQDGYKEGIKYLNELYKLNLIDEESFEQDYNTYLVKARMKNTVSTFNGIRRIFQETTINMN